MSEDQKLSIGPIFIIFSNNMILSVSKVSIGEDEEATAPVELEGFLSDGKESQKVRMELRADRQVLAELIKHLDSNKEEMLLLREEGDNLYSARTIPKEEWYPTLGRRLGFHIDVEDFKKAYPEAFKEEKAE